MHLSECIDLFSESNAVDQEVRECIVNFFLRDKTNFHNDELLKLDPLFGALCLSFSFGGVVMLMLRPKWQEKSNFPYTFVACWLIFVQGTTIYYNISLFMHCSLKMISYCHCFLLLWFRSIVFLGGLHEHDSSISCSRN